MEQSLFLLTIIFTIGTIASVLFLQRQVRRSAWIHSKSITSLWIISILLVFCIVGLWGCYLLFIDFIRW